MTIDNDESIILNDSVSLSFNSLVELSGLTHLELQLLIDSGALIPIHMAPPTPHLNKLKFNSHCLISIRQLVRLKEDLELDANSLSLTLVFLERIRILELQLDHVKNQSST